MSILREGYRGKSLRVIPKPGADRGIVKNDVFVFKDGALIDSTQNTRFPFQNSMLHENDLSAFAFKLEKQFPNLKRAVDRLKPGKSIEVHASRNTQSWLKVERLSKGVRISVCQDIPHNTELHQSPDILASSELSMLNHCFDQLTQLVWQQDQNGRLMWANRAYLEFYDSLQEHSGDEEYVAIWPEKSPFATAHHNVPQCSEIERRMSIDHPQSGKTMWFNVTSSHAQDGTLLHFASNVDELVDLEQRKRNVLQVFGKTFAHLSTGLAIFDQKSQLVSFNPALLVMTQLPVGFVSSRPSFETFLDELRNAGRLPEPSNYGVWKKDLKHKLSQESTQDYKADWTLVSGETYRVTGRPQNDGAFALFFEDVSAELSLTRRFRQEIDAGRGALNALTDGVAVFSLNGSLMMANDSYYEIWPSTLEMSVAPKCINDEMRSWKSNTTPTNAWQALRTFIVSHDAESKELDFEVQLNDGMNVQCHATKSTTCMTTVVFKRDSLVANTLRVDNNFQPSGAL